MTSMAITGKRATSPAAKGNHSQGSLRAHGRGRLGMRGHFPALAVAVCLGTAATAADAQSAGPAIAYAAAGSRGDTIYLVNPDGTGLTKVYEGKSSSRSGAPIERIALRSYVAGGGEIAFIENTWSLKIQRHHSNGEPNGAAYAVSVPAGSCVVGDLDYLSNGTLVLADSCGQAWSVAPGERSAEPLFRAYINSLTAVGDRIYFVESDELKYRESGEPVTVGPVAQPHNYLDATEVTALLSDQQSFHLVSLANAGNDTPGCTQGGMTETSPDGASIIYRFKGNLMLHKSNCAGAPFKIARGVRSFAWRTY